MRVSHSLPADAQNASSRSVRQGKAALPRALAAARVGGRQAQQQEASAEESPRRRAWRSVSFVFATAGATRWRAPEPPRFTPRLRTDFGSGLFKRLFVRVANDPPVVPDTVGQAATSRPPSPAATRERHCDVRRCASRRRVRARRGAARLRPRAGVRPRKKRFVGNGRDCARCALPRSHAARQRPPAAARARCGRWGCASCRTARRRRRRRVMRAAGAPAAASHRMCKRRRRRQPPTQPGR
jgi:hypothetical protein